MPYKRKRTVSFTPSTPYQMAKRFRRVQNRAGVRRALFQPGMGGVRGRMMGLFRQNVFMDKGVFVDEDNLVDIKREGRAEYVTLPSLGQGKADRHTDKIKIYHISMRGALHVKSCKQAETIVARIWLMWAFAPNGGDVPKFADVFSGGSSMDDTHNPWCSRVKHDMRLYYKVLGSRTMFLSPYTSYAPGRNRVCFGIERTYRGDRALYTKFGEKSVNGRYTDIAKGGLFYYIKFVSSDPDLVMDGDINVSITYYH